MTIDDEALGQDIEGRKATRQSNCIPAGPQPARALVSRV